jgi:hypothetical protein
MEWLLLGVIFGFPLLVLAAAAAFAYHDAPNYGMNPRKWAAVSLFVPVFGFFAYLFEREERIPETNDREEMFVDGPFQVHKSRAEDTPFVTGEDDDGAEESRRKDGS